MELTYNELRQRDVINVTDGRCLGRIIDLRLSFPEGLLVGIVVPGRKVKGLFRLCDKSQLYIDESHIIKIGGDVILVDINCGDLCSAGVRVNKPNNNNHGKRPCPPPPCPPPCPPNNQSPCCKMPKQQYDHSQGNQNGYSGQVDFSILSGGDGRINTDDY
jgi:YlmC/YmxH family sporulation protein